MSDPSVPQAALSPALTPEEWAEEITKLEGDARYGIPFWRANTELLRRRGQHAAAALCLFGTTNGFTDDDVEAIEVVLGELRYHAIENVGPTNTFAADVYAAITRLQSLSSRIESLLPPPSPSTTP